MTIRLGTRGSKLALAQAEAVAGRLRENGCACELVVIRTRGDAVQDRPLSELGAVGVFAGEIERALLEGSIDLAVHSLKDLPGELAPGLRLSRFWKREDPRDALVLRPGVSPADLPEDAVIATGSARRAAQLLLLRPRLRVAGVRGNVDTRLHKLDTGEADGLILAAAGLRRLGLEGRVTRLFDPQREMVPACGQGALALESRASDASLAALLAGLADEETDRCVSAERAFLQAAGGGCHAPAGAYARLCEGKLELTAFLGGEAGGGVRRTVCGPAEQGEALARCLAQELRVSLAEGGRA